MLSSCRSDTASNEIVVCIYQLVVLQAQQHEEVHVLLHNYYALFTWCGELTLTHLNLVRSVEDALSHHYLYNVHEEWAHVKFELDHVKYFVFLLT